MKVCFLGDLHIGVRNDSEIFYEYQKKFFVEVLFPYLHKHNIKNIVQLGDFFDRRQYINFKTLDYFYDYFPDLLKKYDIHMVMFLGNHDVALKSSNRINSPSLLLNQIENLTVIEGCTDYTLYQDKEKFTLALVSWINNSNYAECIEYINNTKCDYLAGHFEINGFELHKGHLCDGGMDSNIFEKFTQVISGHFHTKGAKGNILYTGTPYELSWNDWNDSKGFWVLDTKTHEMEMVENTNKLFYKMFYSNDISGKEYITIEPNDIEVITGKYVKLLCTKKDDDYLFEKYTKNLISQMPIDLQVGMQYVYDDISTESSVVATGKSMRELIIENVNISNDKVYNKEIKKMTASLLLEIHNELNTVS